MNDCSFTMAYKSYRFNYNNLAGEKGRFYIPIILIVIRGTDGIEWKGNMQVTGSIYNETQNKHYSFENAANNILEKYQIYNEYITEKYISVEDDNYTTVKPFVFITGHSRGAAVANILATIILDNKEKYQTNHVSAYTYATPNSSLLYLEKEYTNIYNFVLEDDFVPKSPLDKWGYGSCGTMYVG